VLAKTNNIDCAFCKTSSNVIFTLGEVFSFIHRAIVYTTIRVRMLRKQEG
jgi:hypothetical protein